MINQYKFRVGDIIKPIKGRLASYGYNIQHIKKCKVICISKFTYYTIQIFTLEGNIYYRNGYKDKINVIVTVNPDDFELCNSTDNYEIF